MGHGTAILLSKWARRVLVLASSHMNRDRSARAILSDLTRTFRSLSRPATPSGSAPGRSLYVPMRDGVKLGVDLFLPDGMRAHRLPTIVHFTRYFRGISWHPLLEKLGLSHLTDVTRKARARFLNAGYAWVAVDARGSGASYGSRPCEWSESERRDQQEVLDWIAKQPWSSGRIGALGISYSGTCAEFLRIDGHPALRAVAPLYSVFDVYDDVACPGGVQLSWFTKNWGAANDALDRNAVHEVVAGALKSSCLGRSDYHADLGETVRAKIFSLLGTDAVTELTSHTMQRAIRGVRTVDDGTPAAIAEHRDNYDVHASIENIVFRDDTSPSKSLGPLSSNAFSPHAFLEGMRASSVPVLGIGGWHDSGYANAAAKRHAALSQNDSFLVLGPWDHGGTQDTSPFGMRSEPAFDHIAEYIKFFDAHLKLDGEPYEGTPRVRYFTMGPEVWRESAVWPPPEAKPTRLYFGKDGKLDETAAHEPALVPYVVDEELGTGVRSRWRSLLQLRAPVGYSDRSAISKRMLSFTTKPLPAPMEITGHPEIHVFMRANESDATLFAYLEDVHPSGRVQYITEGIFRAIHRKVGSLPHVDPRLGVSHTYLRSDALPLPAGATAHVAFTLQPTSYVIEKGHALRVSIAGRDVDNFARVSGAATKIEVSVGGDQSTSSYVELPVIAR